MRVFDKIIHFSFCSSVTAILTLSALILAMSFVRAAPAEAADLSQWVSASNQWVIAVNSKRSGLSIINASTHSVQQRLLNAMPPVYNYGLFDIAITPDGKTALVSNFIGSRVYIIDISDPENPFVRTKVKTPIFAEDIDVTADGKYAVVTDGGFSSTIVVFDIRTHTITDVFSEPDVYSNGVAIAPDGTVLTVDYFTSSLGVFTINANGKLKYIESIPVSLEGELGRPVNVAISPDGQTVILANVGVKFMSVYRITAPGVVKSENPLTGLAGSCQSIAFHPDGSKAYLSCVYPGPSFQVFIAFADILSPGSVQLKSKIVKLPRYQGSQLFGVDTLAVANNKLFVGNQTQSGAANFLSVVDLTDYSTSVIRSVYPIGVAVVP